MLSQLKQWNLAYSIIVGYFIFISLLNEISLPGQQKFSFTYPLFFFFLQISITQMIAAIYWEK